MSFDTIAQQLNLEVGCIKYFNRRFQLNNKLQIRKTLQLMVR